MKNLNLILRFALIVLMFVGLTTNNTNLILYNGFLLVLVVLDGKNQNRDD